MEVDPGPTQHVELAVDDEDDKDRGHRSIKGPPVPFKSHLATFYFYFNKMTRGIFAMEDCEMFAEGILDQMGGESDLESVRRLIEGMPADEAKQHIAEKFPDVVKKARYAVLVHVHVSKFSVAE